MWDKIWEYLVQLGTTVGLKLLFAAVILIVGIRLIKALQKWLRKTPALQKIDDSVRSFLVSFSVIVLYILLLLSIAMILGIPTTSVLTLFASAGVAIGLALQGALSNFAGGLMILLFKPFRVGDYIEAGDKAGTVQDISVVYTTLLTYDNRRITIPNGVLTNAVLINHTAQPTRRVDLEFSTAYDCGSEKTRAVLLRVANAHPLVLQDPAAAAVMTAHADSALMYALRAWCHTEDYWTVYNDLTEQVKMAFDQENIAIPFPQMDIHLDK